MKEINKRVWKIVFVCAFFICVHSFVVFAGDTIEIVNGVKTTYEERPRAVVDTVGMNYTLKWTLDKQGDWRLYIRRINGRMIELSNNWVKVERMIPYNGMFFPYIDYYYFDINGKMVTGWYIDTNKNTYYLVTSGDDMGRLARGGWYFIGDGYYYFNEAGMLMRNAITPDGFKTDSNGRWQ